MFSSVMPQSCEGIWSQICLSFFYLENDHWGKIRGLGWEPELETAFCTSWGYSKDIKVRDEELLLF